MRTPYKASPTQRRVLLIGGLIVLDGLFFGGLNAAKLPSVFIFVAFALLGVTLYWLSYGVLNLLRLYGLRVTYKKRLALYITGTVTGITALQSIGELAMRDILVLIPLLILAYLYGSYAKAV